MEPKEYSLLRSKINEAEKSHTDWNRDKVLAGLNIATNTQKRTTKTWYFSAAASILSAFFVLYNFSSTPRYQARVSSPEKILPPDTLETKSINSELNPERPVAKVYRYLPTKGPTVIVSEKIKTELVLPAAPSLTDVKNYENSMAYAPTVKKKIKPIVGVMYQQRPAAGKSKLLLVEIEFGKQNQAPNLAYQENNHFLKTTIN